MKAVPAGVPGPGGHAVTVHGGYAVALVLAAAETTLAMAHRMQAQTLAILDNIPSLLAHWAMAPEGVSSALLGLDWLLDGWAHICLIWREAGIAAQRGALSEMALLVSVIPRQATEMTGLPTEEATRQQLRALVLGHQDWRTGAVAMDLIARNEHLLAEAA